MYVAIQIQIEQEGCNRLAVSFDTLPVSSPPAVERSVALEGGELNRPHLRIIRL